MKQKHIHVYWTLQSNFMMLWCELEDLDGHEFSPAAERERERR